MRLVFDLDGTLVDTRRANLEAYASVGVSAPPESVHLPVSQWPTPPTAERHLAKHEVFEKYLRLHGRFLPVAQILAVSPNATILTGSSSQSVRTIRKVFSVLAQYTCHVSLTQNEKIAWLKDHQPGVYFDDWSETVERVRKETRWQAIDVTGF